MNKLLMDANLQSSAPQTYQQLRQVAGRAFLFLDSKLPRKTQMVNPFITGDNVELVWQHIFHQKKPF